MNLRAVFYKRLNESLSSPDSKLLKDDFSITVGPGKVSVSAPYSYDLLVSYIYDPDYYFRFLFSVSSGDQFEGKVSRVPGSNFLEQSFDVAVNLDSLVELIRHWRSALEEELSALPLKRQLEEQQSLLDSLLKQFENLPEEYFTRAEAEDIRAKLDDFEIRFTAHVKISDADSAEKEKKLEQLHQEVEALKAQLDVLKKQGFFKRLYIRLSGIIGEDTTKKLAGEGAEALGRLIKGYVGGGNGDGPSD